MDPLSTTQYSIEEVLRQRWSPISFSNQAVEPEKLRSMLEAARWAASSYNEQPWSYIVATQDNPDEFSRLLKCLAEGNQVWAKHTPVLMLSVAKLTFERNGVENRHAFHDVGAASANLAIEAAAQGLLIHQMAGFDVPKAKETYGIPEGYDPVAAIALGYLGDPQTLSEALQQRQSSPRTRKSLDQFVFTGHWNQTSSIVG
ncbi:nitroreductase [Phormidesmis priestleyi ULC007]|uniref:Nitroreductase n=1 Tax=Phormidesmis priestleyi ULC007 TaxID=1920490 RepID=A0A2T1D373_9CYAN|nr:nitroreductase [Phormidesmis priestleyi ULC007]PZO45940.1 MAG: nitroreductase [Phormidesmis priestleyi]